MWRYKKHWEFIALSFVRSTCTQNQYTDIADVSPIQLGIYLRPQYSSEKIIKYFGQENVNVYTINKGCQRVTK